MHEEEQVALRDVHVSRFAKESVDIEPTAIEEEYVRVPADLAYWGEKYARAYEVHAICKQRSKTLNALLRIEHRERFHEQFQADKAEKNKSGSGRVTDSMVESAVEMDERYQGMQAELIEAEVDLVRVKGTLEAVRTKRDMLVSLGAHIRAEMEGDPVVRAAYADARKFRAITD